MLSEMLLIIAFIPTSHSNKLTLERNVQIKENTLFQTQNQIVSFMKQNHLIT